jgi:L-rhamnose mutarotase
MQRIGFMMRIKPGTEEEYKRRHDEIWPEMLELIRAAGIRNYTIFRQGTTLFNYLECDDWQAVLDRLAKSDVSARWGEYMSDILESDDRFPPLWEEVFRVDR